MSQGKFITFEGLDGAGKSTQVKMFQEYLRRKGASTAFLKGHPAYDGVKEKIIDQFGYIDPLAVFLLTAAKHKTIEMQVSLLLKENDFVIVDRYLDTTISYALANIGEEKSNDLQKIIEILQTLFILPNHTFFIDTPPELALKRKQGQEFDKIELGNQVSPEVDATTSFLINQTKAYTNYKDLIRQQSERWIVVDGFGSPIEIHKEIVRAFENKY